MPKVRCKKCSKWYHGWALLYKRGYCTCGELLNKEDIII